MKKWLPDNTTRGSEGSAKGVRSDRQLLRDRFSARKLLRDNYYGLITGESAVLKSKDHRRLAELIIDHSVNETDMNLVPALKSLSADIYSDESLRQRASEAVEIIQEEWSASIKKSLPLPQDSEESRKAHAMQLLAGTRSPQTSEILRLLRDKSPEQKRMGLYIIGKFRLTDMSAEVCECLINPVLARDAFSVLRSFGSESVRYLQKFYFSSSGNVVASKTIIRLMGSDCIEEGKSFLLSLLGTTSRQIRELTMRYLTECQFKAGEEDKNHLDHLIADTGAVITRILSLKINLDGNRDELLVNELGKEYNRWKTFLDGLISLTYMDEPGKRTDEKGRKGLMPDWVNKAFGPSGTGKPDLQHDHPSFRKLLRLLAGYFPSRVPDYNVLHEDIINCDYNLLSIWTKACAVRNIREIGDDDMAESVIALLFSPGELLREEAGRLIARSGKDFYMNAIGRVPPAEQEKLEGIVSGRTGENEFLFEKVLFLSSCFGDIPEDELLLLAAKMRYLTGDIDGLKLPAEGFILWIFGKDKSDPYMMVEYEVPGAQAGPLHLPGDTEFCYLLPLSAVEEFDYHFTESSRLIYEFIDVNEG
ncbi:MAG: hypothetical protein K0B05_06035 [Bacteroidales bacterium]|nr:hypothetical protein [Bacteroidales bacterium]